MIRLGDPLEPYRPRDLAEAAAFRAALCEPCERRAGCHFVVEATIYNTGALMAGRPVELTHDGAGIPICTAFRRELGPEEMNDEAAAAAGR